MTKAKLIAAAVVAVLVISTLAQNADPVAFKFWPLVDFRVSKTVLIIVSAACGSVATLGLQWYLRRPGPRSSPGDTARTPPLS